MKRKLENSVENLMKISPKIKFLKTLAKFFNWKKKKKNLVKTFNWKKKILRQNISLFVFSLTWKKEKKKKRKENNNLKWIYKLKDDKRQWKVTIIFKNTLLHKKCTLNLNTN
jgi:hypothetical protein